MNFTGGIKDTQAVLQLRCSADWTSGIQGEFLYLSAFNIFLSITAVLGNILILVALRKVSSLHPPSKLLFRCLATTDLCIGLTAEPLSIVYWMSLTHEQWKLCRYAYASFFVVSYTLSSVSLLTMSAISVDRLLALLLGLRYRQVVTLKRTYVIVVIFWIISAVVSISYLLNRIIPIWYGYIIIPLCLLTSIFSYTNIFLKLRRHQTQIQGHIHQEQPGEPVPLNIERYRKAVSSALWVQCTLVACYLPFPIVRALVVDNIGNSKLSPSSLLSFDVATSLIYLNSSLNPILYCWKISEVKQAVKETIRQALCCLPS